MSLACLPCPGHYSFSSSSMSSIHSNMASINRGRPLARHTKDSSALKTSSNSPSLEACDYDAASSKPTPVGRDVVDATQASPLCKGHICDGHNFSSNVTYKKYDVISPNMTTNCSTKNIIYLITCKKCGIQYVGETSQALRSRFNNHRNRLKQLCDLHLYNHFNSDGHSLDDIQIMPIEEVVVLSDDNLNLVSKRQKEKNSGIRSYVLYTPMALMIM